MHRILNIAASFKDRLRLHAVSLHLSRTYRKSLTWQLAYATLLLGLAIRPCASSWAGTTMIGSVDGSFETGLHDLTLSGDVRLLTSLGLLWPSQGTQAVVMTTAPDTGAEQVHTDISVIRIDSLTIPPDIPQLRLDYTFLSNERMPSFTNDAFTVTLALMNGGEVTLLHVDTFDLQYPAAWTGYAMQTGFRTLVADLSAYAATGDIVSLELRLTDVGDGRSNSAVLLDNLQLTSPDEPLACANIVQQTLQPGDTLFADGSCSSDRDDLIVEYRWDFGDGTASIGRFVEHTYAAEGVYQATLRVKDQAGHRSTIPFHVVVNGTPPIANAGGPYVVTEADANNGKWPVALDGSASSDAEGDIRSYIWNVDASNGISIDASAPTAHHLYTAPGVYTVTLTVTDAAGQTDSDTTSVTVTAGEPPVASLTGPSRVDESQASGGQWPFHFDASSSSDDHGIFTYSWDFGDGNSGTGIDPTHLYTAPGTYPVTLTVTDHAGQQSSSTFTVVAAAGSPPLANAGGPYVFGEAAATFGVWRTSLDASGSSDDVGIYAYEWWMPSSHDFAGTHINSSVWLTSNGVTQDETITVPGGGYLFSSEAQHRFFQAQVRPLNTTGFQFGMWGMRRADASNFSFTSMPYAIYFRGSDIQIYEDGTSRGSFASYTRGELYDIRIAVKRSGAGARYEFKRAEDADWRLLYDSEHPTNVPLQVGGTVISGTFMIDNVQRSTVYSGPTLDRSFSIPGVYDLILKVWDNALQTDSDATTVTITSGAPPVADAGGPYILQHGRLVAFSSAAASDDVGIVRYRWEFGDGTTHVEPHPVHVYAVPDSYTVTLTVTDAALQTDSATTTVRVGRVSQVDTTGLSGDWQTLDVSGNLAAQVDNPDAIAMGPFTLTFFDDLNHNGRFDAGVDTRLGQTTQDGLAAGEHVLLTAPVSGPVRFRNSLLYAFIDPADASAPADPGNYANSAQACIVIPPADLFDPVLEWAWTDPSVLPNAVNVMSTPAVIDLDGDGMPELVVQSTASTSGANINAGYLRVLDGASGRERFTVTSQQVNVTSQPAVGDIDLDGRPEIVTVHHDANRLIAFEHNGLLKWESPLLETVALGGPALADLDADGWPEIVVGRQVLNHDGSLRWTGSGGRANHRDTGGPLSLVADLDLDGTPEVIAGNTAYKADGTIAWQAALTDGFNAIANFDADPFAEVVLVSQGEVWLLEHDGTVKWGPAAIPRGGNGGPPTVADYDSDGEVEIGVAGQARYAVFETDGSLKWQAAIQDGSSQMTGSSVFDFDGDGAVEVVYRDELMLRVYSGIDGTVLFATPQSSGTGYEYPLMADVDGDGKAELISVANTILGFGPQQGVFVFGSASDSWVATRPIWNQHTYHVTNVSDDGRIPPHEAPSWQTHNAYRRNLLTRGDTLRLPDLTASFVRLEVQDGVAQVTARIGNGGAFAVPAGVRVAFYDGNPATGGAQLGSLVTATDLMPNTFEDVTLQVGVETANPLWVVVDENGAIVECDESNNRHNAGLSVQFNQPPVADAGGPYTTQEGVALTLDGTGSTDPDGNTLTYSWDLDNDGVFDDASGATTPLTLFDNGTFTISLQVSDGIEVSTDAAVVTVINVAPVVIAGPNQSTLEGGHIGLAPSTYTDAGTADTHHATIDWGDGSVEAGTLNAVSSSGTVSGAHLYDDDGLFSVTVCVTDNDAASGCDTLDVTVENSLPTTTLDTTDAVALTADGASFFINQANASQTRSASGTDMGSDDLTFTWLWGDGTVVQNTHFNNGSTADSRPPANRGAVAPFSATDTVSHTYTTAGSYTLRVHLSDDDTASGQAPASATIPILITDKQDCAMTLGFWQHQFNPETRKPQVDLTAQQAYLALINSASGVFSEVLAVSTRADAWLLLQPKDTAATTMQGQAAEQALTAWLNFAWGAVGWDTGIPDLGRPFHQVMADIEAAFLNPDADHTDYVWANDLAVTINEMDAKTKACR